MSKAYLYFSDLTILIESVLLFFLLFLKLRCTRFARRLRSEVVISFPVCPLNRHFIAAFVRKLCSSTTFLHYSILFGWRLRLINFEAAGSHNGTAKFIPT